MKIWVTGEAGCIARNLADYCNVRTDYEVVNRLSEDYYDYWRMAITSPTKEINIFDPSLPRLIEDSGADVIVHAAAINHDMTKKDPHLAIHTNIDGTFRMGEIAKKLDIPVIYLSADNDEFMSPNIYAATKSCGELLLLQTRAVHTSISLANIYGKYDTTSYIAKMILSSTGNQVKLPADISKKREFIHTSELIQVIEYVLDHNIYEDVDPATASFSTTSATLEEIYTELNSILPYPPDCVFDDENYMERKVNKTISEVRPVTMMNGIIKNRIVMKDAIVSMIEDLL